MRWLLIEETRRWDGSCQQIESLAPGLPWHLDREGYQTYRNVRLWCTKDTKLRDHGTLHEPIVIQEPDTNYLISMWTRQSNWVICWGYSLVPRTVQTVILLLERFSSVPRIVEEKSCYWDRKYEKIRTTDEITDRVLFANKLIRNGLPFHLFTPSCRCIWSDTS